MNPPKTATELEVVFAEALGMKPADLVHYFGFYEDGGFLVAAQRGWLEYNSFSKAAEVCRALGGEYRYKDKVHGEFRVPVGNVPSRSLLTRVEGTVERVEVLADGRYFHIYLAGQKKPLAARTGELQKKPAVGSRVWAEVEEGENWLTIRDMGPLPPIGPSPLSNAPAEPKTVSSSSSVVSPGSTGAEQRRLSG